MISKSGMFEQIYTIQFLSKKPQYAFILGLFYSLLSMVTALVLFPSNPSLAAIAFTTIAIVPSLNMLLLREENIERKFKAFSIKKIFTAHEDMFKIYFFLFFGILLTFSIFSIILPDMAKDHLFSSQLNIFYKNPVTGEAGNFSAGFLSLFENNMKVLLVFLVLSFIYGSGSVFLLTWNASVWGAIFGEIAHQAALTQGVHPVLSFFSLFISVFPHTLLEALGYFGASIGGGIISTAVLRENIFSTRFRIIATDGMVLFLISAGVIILGAFIESFLL